MNDSDREAFDGIVRQMEVAWKAGDGDAFAVPFAEDADFVNIRAEHFRGRDTIARGHTEIFSTIYAGSSIACTIEAARLLDKDVALVHVKSELECPTGPLAGRHVARFSMVLTRSGGEWRIASFHNTMTPPAR